MGLEQGNKKDLSHTSPSWWWLIGDLLKHAGFFNTSSCWLYSCLHWIKDCLGQTRWGTKETGKDLAANTVHPLMWRCQTPTVPGSGCCTDRNKLVCAWKCLHGLCMGVKFLRDICPVLRLSMFFLFNHLLGAKTPQRNNSHLWALLPGETSSCSWSK